MSWGALSPSWRRLRAMAAVALGLFGLELATSRNVTQTLLAGAVFFAGGAVIFWGLATFFKRRQAQP